MVVMPAFTRAERRRAHLPLGGRTLFRRGDDSRRPANETRVAARAMRGPYFATLRLKLASA